MDATTLFFVIFFLGVLYTLLSGGARPLTDEEKKRFEKDNSVVNDSSTGSYIK